MTIDELRWFLELAETEHMTQAADRLHITQSTLSRALRRLERGVGVQLFDRNHQRLRLNEYGQVFRRHARRALDELDVAQDRITSLMAPPREPVSLAFAHSFASWLVPEVLGAYQREFSDVRFVLRQDTPEGMLKLLLAGMVEMILTAPRPPGPQISWLPLMDEPLHLVVPADHHLACRSEVKVIDIVDVPLILLRHTIGLRGIIRPLLHSTGVTPIVVAEAEDFPTVKSLVASGLGVSVLPAGDRTPPPPGVRMIPIADSGAYRPVGIAWDTTQPATTAARRFREFVARYAKTRAESVEYR
ncbi:LysR family transcriptional regulator [Microbispora sp. RL4-1S]|uniref:LysR family transcriptional regulator n=1 Tax=Microbispora oryzae TaxID=2806554 RepID=A0A940WQR0_9ACTN|nr:LysR family transcriptional regulator [Microbispora oryzae]MBP2707842.1 LysR family transcriptional regulator [Microbispora oryzae]